MPPAECLGCVEVVCQASTSVFAEVFKFAPSFCVGRGKIEGHV